MKTNEIRINGNEIVIKDGALITSLKLYKRFEDANSIRIIISKEGEQC